MSSSSIAWSTQLSNTAACLHFPILLFFSPLGILSLLSLITEVPVEATDWDLLNDQSGVLDGNLLLLLLPASSCDDELSSSGSGTEAAMLNLLILEEPAAEDCYIPAWVELTFWAGCTAGVVWLEVSQEVGWAGAVTAVISRLKIVGTDTFAGIGAVGFVRATGCARNNSLYCGPVLELPMAAAYSSLKISVLRDNDYLKSWHDQRCLLVSAV